MLEKIKAVLNNSLTWLLLLLGAVFFFWKKERDAEFQLEETKVNDEIKSDQKVVSQADSAANADTGTYEQLRSEYIAQHPDDKV